MVRFRRRLLSHELVAGPNGGVDCVILDALGMACPQLWAALGTLMAAKALRWGAKWARTKGAAIYV